jgi:predicted glutamine amidotransferase
VCGIVGFITTDPIINVKRANYFEQALYADAVRGRHSTGVFTVEHDGKAFFNKDIVDAQRFLDSQGSYRYVRSVDSGVRVAVGHNRYATMGGRGRDSAHPFCTQHVTLVHNGTLRDYQWMKKYEKADVDSARLAQTLSEDEPGGKATLEKVKGAYALVWYDNRTQHLYMARNSERPLYLATVDGTLYFASEGKMLEWLLSDPRTGISNNAKAHILPTHSIHRWAVTAKDPVLKPKVTKYTPPKPVVYEPVYGAWNGGGQHGHGAQQALNLVGAKAGEGAGKVLSPQSRASATDLNTKLKELGFAATYGDIIEVQAGELELYSNAGILGRTLGWFEEDEAELLLAENSDFRGQVYADVHQVPMLTKAKVQEGHWHDSYQARIVGISPVQPDWMCANDVLLSTVFEAVGGRSEPYTLWTGKLKKFFKTTRHRYSINDLPKWELNGAKLTNRELDMLTVEKKCVSCSTPADLIPREEIRIGKSLKFLSCTTCLGAVK